MRTPGQAIIIGRRIRRALRVAARILGFGVRAILARRLSAGKLAGFRPGEALASIRRRMAFPRKRGGL